MYISIALCLPAVLIFVSYRKLRVIRVILHRNLLIACIARSILIIVQKELVILDALKPVNVSNGVMEENGMSCKMLAFANNVGTNLIYACMLMDGYYLHKLIVRLFSEDPNIYKLYGITAGTVLILQHSSQQKVHSLTDCFVYSTVSCAVDSLGSNGTG